MNRRQLLAALLGSATIATVGELLVPTRKFFLPPRGGWASGGYIDPGRPYLVGEQSSEYVLSPVWVWMTSEEPLGAVPRFSMYADGKLTPIGRIIG
jgi:hypothetical protein